jgi:nucleotide-binding universal stress UspA family protein
MAGKILVPTDGSEMAEKAADWAIDLAKATGDSLIFLSVVDDYAPAFSYDLETGVTIDLGEMIKMRDQYIRDFVDKLADKAKESGVKSEGKIIQGHAWEEILNEAEGSGVNMIVMGSHGRRALAAAVMGNVTINVIHGAKVPVTVIPFHGKK